METGSRQTLHELVDSLPEAEIESAQKLLADLCHEVDEEPFTGEDAAAVERGRRQIENGDWVSLAELRCEFSP